jgi:hypothetical protein
LPQTAQIRLAQIFLWPGTGFHRITAVWLLLTNNLRTFGEKLQFLDLRRPLIAGQGCDLLIPGGQLLLPSAKPDAAQEG